MNTTCPEQYLFWEKETAAILCSLLQLLALLQGLKTMLVPVTTNNITTKQ